MDQKKVGISLFYVFLEKISVKVFGLIISILLARMLQPETFGLLAVITVFINLAQTFVNGGFGTALVQNQTTNDEDYSTVFFLSFGIAVFSFGVLFFCAPMIGRFSGNSELIAPLRVLAVSLLPGAYQSVQNAKLQRQMRFSIMMRCNLAATIVSGIFGVVAAYFGAEIWALVIYQLSCTVLSVLLVLIADKWWPSLIFSPLRAKVFWGFGWKMLVSGLLTTIYNDVRSLVIGWKYSIADLAYYNRGQQMPDVIANTLDVSIQSVMLPVMSQAQNEMDTLRTIFGKTLSLSVFVVTPVMAGLASVANTLVPLLLTEKWNDCIPLMVVFCLANLTIPVMTTNLSVIKALGRSDLYMKTEAVRRIMMTGVLLITILCFDSVFAIALSYMLSAVLDCLIIIYVVNRLIHVGVVQQAKIIRKSVVSGIVMAIVVCFMNLLPITGGLKLCLQVISGATVYVGCSVLLKSEDFLYLWSLLKNRA